MGQLSGKVAIVTGGASGIGAATVRMFAAEGAKVAIADILDDEAQKIVKSLGSSAIYLRTDVGDEAQVRATIERTAEHFGRLDCIFNNAGFGGVDGPIAETDSAGLLTTTAVLFNGVVYGIKHAAEVMKKQGSGSIISTGSVAGLRAGFGPHVYSALKAAVIHLTRSVSMELGESGVRVNCICPGGIVTPIFGRQYNLSQTEIEERTSLLNQIFTTVQPIRRPGQPEDIARAALWLASDASSFVNGHALVVDGGLIGGVGWSQAQELGVQMRALMGIPEDH